MNSRQNEETARVAASAREGKFTGGVSLAARWLLATLCMWAPCMVGCGSAAEGTNAESGTAQQSGGTDEQEYSPSCADLQNIMGVTLKEIEAKAPQKLLDENNGISPTDHDIDLWIQQEYVDLVTWHNSYEKQNGEGSMRWNNSMQFSNFVKATGGTFRDFRESVCLDALPRTPGSAYNFREGGLRGALECARFEKELDTYRAAVREFEDMQCAEWMAEVEPPPPVQP
jgi:hypothetical protein